MFGLTFSLEITALTFKLYRLVDIMSFLGTLDCFLLIYHKEKAD